MLLPFKHIPSNDLHHDGLTKFYRDEFYKPDPKRPADGKLRSRLSCWLSRCMDRIEDILLLFTDRQPISQPIIVIGQLITLRQQVLGILVHLALSLKLIVPPAVVALTASVSLGIELYWVDQVHHGLALLAPYIPSIFYWIIDHLLDRFGNWIGNIDRAAALKTEIGSWALFYLILLWNGKKVRKIEWLEKYLRVHGVEVIDDGDFTVVRSTIEPVGSQIRLHRRAPTHPVLRLLRYLQNRVALTISYIWH